MHGSVIGTLFKLTNPVLTISLNGKYFNLHFPSEKEIKAWIGHKAMGVQSSVSARSRGQPGHLQPAPRDMVDGCIYVWWEGVERGESGCA